MGLKDTASLTYVAGSLGCLDSNHSCSQLMGLKREENNCMGLKDTTRPIMWLVCWALWTKNTSGLDLWD